VPLNSLGPWHPIKGDGFTSEKKKKERKKKKGTIKSYLNVFVRAHE